MIKDTSLFTKLHTEEKWSFDKVFLVEAIKQGREKLNSGELSRRKKQSLRVDIEIFERYVKGDFEMEAPSTYMLSFPKNVDKLKDYILTRMIKQYKMLGEDVISWTMRLCEENVFEQFTDTYYRITELSLEEKAELTIKNYENNSPVFLESAKRIILDNSIRQIQSVDFCSSYCHYDSITGQPYIVIDSQDVACMFNHEVQHAIEILHKYLANPLYSELGPILYEMLFNEELYKSRGYLHSGDCSFRIEEAMYLLEIVSNYFQVLLSFKEKNFDISTDEFLKTFEEIEEIEPTLLVDYLKEEIANDNIVSDMSYLFSFLKAIELREEKIKSYSKQPELLEYYIKRKTFDFQIPQDGFDIYKRYVEEMNQKVRRKSK